MVSEIPREVLEPQVLSITGGQWGDERKGKETDILASEYDVGVRHNGGVNAGHTVYRGKNKIALHGFPVSGLHEHMTSFLGPGYHMEPISLYQESKDIEPHNPDAVKKLRISDKACLTLPDRIFMDVLRGGAVGTTTKGIGPTSAARCDREIAYDGKTLLRDVRVGHALEGNDFLSNVLDSNFKYFIETTPMSLEQKEKFSTEYPLKRVEFLEAMNFFRDCIETNPFWLLEKYDQGKRLLFEGAQGEGLDLMHGTTPGISATHISPAAIFYNAGLPVKPAFNLGVFKVIMSRVGAGGYPSELGTKRSEERCGAKDKDRNSVYSREVEALLNLESLFASEDDLDIGTAFRASGNEYGATTGRPRRIGLFDLVQAKQAVRLGGLDGIFLTKLDCLPLFSKTKFRGPPVTIGYDLDGMAINYLPTTSQSLRRIRAINTVLAPITDDFSGETNYNKLPRTAKDYVEFVEKFVGCRVYGVGTGPQPEHVAWRKD